MKKLLTFGHIVVLPLLFGAPVLGAEGDAMLRTSVQLAAPPLAAALPDLERELAHLRRGAFQSQAELADLRQRLDAAQPWSTARVALEAFAALLLAAAATAATLAWRTRRSEAMQRTADTPPSPAAPLTQHEPQAVGPSAQTAPAEPAPSTSAAKSGASRPYVLREGDGALRVETLAAVFDEADFLGSLGLAGQARAVLQAYVEDSAGPAPLAFHEWARRCEQEGDAAGADDVRRRYEETFGVEAPGGARLAEPSGLEGHADLAARITAAWNTPRVLQVIEDALFPVPGEAAPLTLQAGRDLLCLHGLATQLAVDAPDAVEEGYVLAPWADIDDLVEARLAVQAAGDDTDGGALGVDIDLGVVAEPDLAPLIAEMQAAAREAEAARRRREQEEAFNAVMSHERIPALRH